jgi:hypothetical protein
MKQCVLICLASVVSLLVGAAITSSRQATATSANQNSTVAQPSLTPSPCPEPDPFPKLIEDRYVTKFNGTRIRLDYDTGVTEGDIPWSVDNAQITPLNGGDLLINLGDSLYRINHQQRVVWRHPTPQVVLDYVYVEATNLVYGTAGDNIMFILNADTGKELHSDSRNGSAA